MLAGRQGCVMIGCTLAPTVRTGCRTAPSRLERGCRPRPGPRLLRSRPERMSVSGKLRSMKSASERIQASMSLSDASGFEAGRELVRDPSRVKPYSGSQRSSAGFATTRRPSRSRPNALPFWLDQAVHVQVLVRRVTARTRSVPAHSGRLRSPAPGKCAPRSSPAGTCAGSPVS